MAKDIKIKEKSEYTKLQTVWYYTRRFLRTVVPQIPALLAWANIYFSEETVPYFVAFGGLLTVADKLCRDKGFYGN